MWRGMVVAIALAGFAFSASLGLPSDLYNGGFETGDLEGWTSWGQSPWVVTNWYNLYPQEGEFMAVWEDTSGTEGAIEQIVPITCAPSYIDLSGWIFVAGEYAWVEVVLTAGGEPIASQTFSNTEDWQYFEIMPDEPTEVVCYKDVHIIFHNDEACPGFAAIDGLDLEEVIPEPSTVALLLSGLAGIAGFVRRIS